MLSEQWFLLFVIIIVSVIYCRVTNNVLVEDVGIVFSLGLFEIIQMNE